MNPETLLSGIREMISAQVRLVTTADPDEKRIAGELYTTNEAVVLDELTHLYGFQQEIANNLAKCEARTRSLPWRRSEVPTAVFLNRK